MANIRPYQRTLTGPKEKSMGSAFQIISANMMLKVLETYDAAPESVGSAGGGYDLSGVACDHHLLIGGDDNNFHLRVGT